MKHTTLLVSDSNADRRCGNGCRVSQLLDTHTFLTYDAITTVALPPASVIRFSNEMCTENQFLFPCVDIVVSSIFSWLCEILIRSAQNSNKKRPKFTSIYSAIHTFVGEIHVYMYSLYECFTSECGKYIMNYNCS